MINTSRRKRRIAGHLEQAIRELALQDYSVSQIAKELERRGEKDVPDARTIRSIVAELGPPDPSDAWTLRAANAEDVALVMPVLQAVIENTQGRRDKLAMAEASWSAKLRRAAPDLPAWNTYALARLYVGADRLGRPTEHLDTLVAFAPWRGAAERDRYIAAVRRLRVELLAVVPDLLAGPDAPIRVTPTGPGEWRVGEPRESAAARRKAAGVHATRLEALEQRKPPLYRAACSCEWFGEWREERETAARDQRGHAPRRQNAKGGRRGKTRKR